MKPEQMTQEQLDTALEWMQEEYLDHYGYYRPTLDTTDPEFIMWLENSVTQNDVDFM